MAAEQSMLESSTKASLELSTPAARETGSPAQTRAPKQPLWIPSWERPSEHKRAIGSPTPGSPIEDQGLQGVDPLQRMPRSEMMPDPLIVPLFGTTPSVPDANTTGLVEHKASVELIPRPQPSQGEGGAGKGVEVYEIIDDILPVSVRFFCLQPV